MALLLLLLCTVLQRSVASLEEQIYHGKLLSSDRDTYDRIHGVSLRRPEQAMMSVPEPQSPPREGSWTSRIHNWRRRLLRETNIGIYSELEAYLEAQAAQQLVDCNLAQRNQSMPTSAQLGMPPWDPMKELESIPARIAFLNQLTEEVCSNATGRLGHGTNVRVAAFGVWNGNMWGLRRALLPWLQWHTQLGVCRFYISFQGRDEETLRALKKITSISLILISPPFAPASVVEEFRKYAATHEWGRRPGNWRLMTKQCYSGDMALALARKEGIQFMAHIDADELMMPSTSLAADLAASPPWAGSLKMHNHEALVESFEISNKFEEVTLFKTHDATLPEKAGDLQWRFRMGLHGAFYQVYHNGKSIARVDKAHVHMWGPHEFLGPKDDVWKHPTANPEGEFKAEKSNITLLHISYTSWRDLIGKARSSCPRMYADAARAGNRTKVEECFCLGFDLDAYMAAMKGEEAAREYWVANSLFSEGAVRKEDGGCRVYRDVQRLKDLMIRDRFLLRITAPQQVLRAHEIAIRAMARSMGIHLVA